MGLPGADPPVHHLPFSTLRCFRMIRALNLQCSALQQFSGIPDHLIHPDPVGVVGRPVFYRQKGGAAVLILELKLKIRQRQHMTRRRFGLRTHIGVRGKFSLAVLITDGLGRKFRSALLIRHHGPAHVSQRPVQQLKLRPGQFHFRLIGIGFHQFQLSVGDAVNHLHRLQFPGIPDGKRNADRLEKSVGGGYLLQNIIPLRNVADYMGLQIPYLKSLRNLPCFRFLPGIDPVHSGYPAGLHLLVGAALAGTADHKGLLRHISLAVCLIDCHCGSLYLFSSGNIHLGYLERQRPVAHLKRLDLFQMAGVLNRKEHGRSSGVPRRIPGFHQDIASHRQILNPCGAGLRIIIAPLKGVGDRPVAVIVLHDRMIPRRVRSQPARSRHLLAVPVSGGAERENLIFRVKCRFSGLIHHRNTFLIQQSGVEGEPGRAFLIEKLTILRIVFADVNGCKIILHAVGLHISGLQHINGHGFGLNVSLLIGAHRLLQHIWAQRNMVDPVRPCGGNPLSVLSEL